MNVAEVAGRCSGFYQRQKEVLGACCLIVRGGYSEVYGLNPNGTLDGPVIRRGFKFEDSALLSPYFEIRDAVNKYSRVTVIGKEKDLQGNWVTTNTLNIRGKK